MATPRKGDGIGYLDHYNKYFLTPYGAVKEFPKEDLSKKIKPQNCEFFKRPAVFVSEVASTLANNSEFLEGLHPTISDKIQQSEP